MTAKDIIEFAGHAFSDNGAEAVKNHIKPVKAVRKNMTATDMDINFTEQKTYMKL